jgi:hypothetical protein
MAPAGRAHLQAVDGDLGAQHGALHQLLNALVGQGGVQLRRVVGRWLEDGMCAQLHALRFAPRRALLLCR